MKQFFITLLLLFLVCTGFSTNYYISTTGSDANNGLTSGTAKATFNTGIFATFNLAAGDTIFVAPGTYTESAIIVGSDDEGFTIQGAALSNGTPTSIFDAGAVARWLLIKDSNNDNITINNLTIKDYVSTGGATPDGGGAIKNITGCTGLKINYCVFDNCEAKQSYEHRGGGIYSEEGVEITYSTFKNCNSASKGGAISIEVSPTNATNINNCTFYSNNTAVYGTAIFYSPSTALMTIKNSLFYKNGLTLGEGCIVTSGTGTNISIKNSTITNNGNTNVGTGGVLVLSSAIATLTNTIIYSNLGTTYNDVYNNTSTITMTNCLYGIPAEINSITTNTNPKVHNPLFTNATIDDYTLQSTSPAIDSGTVTGAPIDDILGVTRDSKPDIGCYEYKSSTSLPIELLSFTGECVDNNVKLIWSTASELNNNYFVLENSLNGIDYLPVTTIIGAGNSSDVLNYTYTGENNGSTYYRLKQVDYDGKFKYYGPIAIICNTTNDYLMYFDYVRNDLVIINSPEVHLNITIRNQIGQLETQFVCENPGTHRFNLNNYSPGFHVIIGMNDLGNVQVLKVIKK